MSEKDEPKESLARYRKFFGEAEGSVAYWSDEPVTEFVEEVCHLMEEKNVSRAELARRLGTSRAYVTKLLDGNANFTLATMVKVAMALDGTLHVHISDKRALTRWYDELPGEEKPGMSGQHSTSRGQKIDERT